ncbi:response regulator [Chryseobacterium taichungense]|uniref:response regulator n=1 Tax=Chryseobacterium taichungense TaxID=295069 RepID=UPI0028A9929F|nr:response regulator [Chryseobacterium taichungense]
MNKEYLNIFLADDDEGKLILLEKILRDLKIHSKIKTFSSSNSLLDYLQHNILVPEVLFMNYHIPGKNCLNFLSEIRADRRFDHMITIIYSENLSAEQEEEIFVTGTNVVMKMPDNYKDMKKSVSDIMSVTWQYHTAGLNKNNFIMKV